MLDVRRDLIFFVSGVPTARRHEIETWKDTHKTDCYQQGGVRAGMVPG